MAIDQLSGHMAEERAEAVRTMQPPPWAAAIARHPVLFAPLVLVAVFLVSAVLGQLFGDVVGFSRHPSARLNEWYTMLDEMLACAVVIALLVALGWWRRVGFTGPRSWRSVHLVWFPALMLAVLLIIALRTSAVTTDVPWLAIAIPYVFTVGFFEEALLRGLVLFPLLYAWRCKPHGVLWAVLTSSALFGLMHLNNLRAGQSLGETLTQVGYATFLGIGLAGLALRTNTLWLGVIWHGLCDTIGEALGGPQSQPDTNLLENLATLGLLAPMAIYGLILIRRRTHPPATTEITPPTTQSPDTHAPFPQRPKLNQESAPETVASWYRKRTKPTT